MADTQQIIRRLQGEGIVACVSMRDPDMVVANANADTWAHFFDSFLIAAEQGLEKVPYPTDLRYNIGYRIGFKHGLGAAMLAIRRLREAQ